MRTGRFRPEKGIKMEKPIPLQTGDIAPDFNLVSGEGKHYSLADFFNKKRVVLYFYPKDDTPGCTLEACSFRDYWKEIEQTGAVVVGVSPDTEESHHKFTAKHGLNFPLLSDHGHEVAERYGAWGEKNMYGRKTMGMLRQTFIIGQDGRIETIFRKVKAENHARIILDYLVNNPE